MDHIVLDLNEGTYSLNDGLKEVEKRSPFSIHNLQRIFSREKKNIARREKGIYVLRVTKKNETLKIDK